VRNLYGLAVPSTVSDPESRPRLLSPTYAAITIGMFALSVVVAFEALAVTTVMPTVAKDLDGLDLFALAFAAPLASGVVGMVAAGTWSDRRGPVAPLVAALAFFSVGLVVCGTAPSMEVLVAGRVLQGLGGGALAVVLYVLVGKVFPSELQAALFASFAAAWVLPALFGPALAAYIAHALGWRWVFLIAVALTAASASLVAPSLRRLAPHQPGAPAPRSRLVWAVVAAVAVLAIDRIAVVAVVVVVVALAKLLPAGSLLARRGLPAVVAARGLMSASFFCAQAYIVFVLEENWDLSPGIAGLVLSFVGIVWAAGSQVSARVGDRVSDSAAMVWGNTLLLVGMASLAGTIWADLHPAVAMAAFVVAAAGMGFGYPRTGVAMLTASSDSDRGFNSSALAMADSLGSALTLSLAGVVYAAATHAGRDPFLEVFALAAAVGALSVVSAVRTSATRPA